MDIFSYIELCFREQPRHVEDRSVWHLWRRRQHVQSGRHCDVTSSGPGRIHSRKFYFKLLDVPLTAFFMAFVFLQQLQFSLYQYSSPFRC